MLQTVKAVITTAVVGINIEDSLKQQEKALVDISYQVELIKALRELATSMDVPFVINAPPVELNRGRQWTLLVPVF